MTTRTIKGIFQAALLGGVIGLAPAAARASDGSMDTGADEGAPDVPAATAPATQGSITPAPVATQPGWVPRVPTLYRLTRPLNHEAAEARAEGVQASAPGVACSGPYAQSCLP
jgi:hypothetical protein